MTRLDTHTIEKIVYKDIEVFDPIDYDIVGDDGESNVNKLNDSSLDDILDQVEPTNSIASRLLKEVWVEVTEEQIDEIQDPALKQLMLQKKIQQLMNKNNTHSSPWNRPFVISPNEVLK